MKLDVLMERGHLQNPAANRGYERLEVGMARCAVRAASSGATVPPAATRAGTSQRDVPTKFRFMEAGFGAFLILQKRDNFSGMQLTE